MKHRAYVALSGFMWFFMGGYLLCKGLYFITKAPSQIGSLCSKWENPQQAATMFLGLGLAIGFLKGRFVLAKTVRRVVTRLSHLPLPIRFTDAYAKSYWILIAFMMALGMSFRFLPVPIDIRGLIDVAVGSALINGSMLFFRAAILRPFKKCENAKEAPRF